MVSEVAANGNVAEMIRNETKEKKGREESIFFAFGRVCLQIKEDNSNGGHLERSLVQFWVKYKC